MSTVQKYSILEKETLLNIVVWHKSVLLLLLLLLFLRKNIFNKTKLLTTNI